MGGKGGGWVRVGGGWVGGGWWWWLWWVGGEVEGMCVCGVGLSKQQQRPHHNHHHHHHRSIDPSISHPPPQSPQRPINLLSATTNSQTPTTKVGVDVSKLWAKEALLLNLWCIQQHAAALVQRWVGGGDGGARVLFTLRILHVSPSLL